MHLPAIKEKISQLPRKHRLLFLINLIVILLIIIGGTIFYFSSRREGEMVEVVYRRGPIIEVRDSLGNELECIVGKIVKRDGFDLIVEKGDQQRQMSFIKEALIYQADLRSDMIPPSIKKLNEKDKLSASDLTEGKMVQMCDFLEGENKYYAVIVFVQK